MVLFGTANIVFLLSSHEHTTIVILAPPKFFQMQKSGGRLLANQFGGIDDFAVADQENPVAA